MQNHVFDMTSSPSAPGLDRKLHPPFQAIIEKGRQAKAQVEQEQYEARKAKRETEVKNAARIRHAEAEANRRRAEESKLSVDDLKGRLLHEMTSNIRAVLEDKYRDEIRAKVYENEDRIVSAYEQDIKDQTKARLVKELESVVKAKLGAEFEPEVKQRLAVELTSVVKAELRATHELEVRQQLVKDLGPVVEIELRAMYETEVKRQLAEDLQSGIKAELRAQYGKETKDQLMNESESTIIHDQKGTQADDVQNERWGRRDASHTPGETSFGFTHYDINAEGGEYPDLSHHQHLINQNGVLKGQQEAGSVLELENTIIDGDAVVLPRGTKRSLGDVDGEEEDPYVRRSKRSRSASCDGEEQQLPSRNEKRSSNPYSRNIHIEESHQSALYNREDSHGLLQENGDDDLKVARGNDKYLMDRGTSGYNSSSEVQGSQEDILGYRRVDYNSAEDVQAMNGNLDWTDHASVENVQETNGDHLYREKANSDSQEDVQGVNGTFLDRKGADFDSAEDMRGINGNFLSREEANYDSAEDFRESDGYKLASKATESDNSQHEDEDNDEEDDEEDEEGDYEEDDYEEYYESEEEEKYSTAPQPATNSSAGNGVISFSNTQDTAFVLSDSEDEAEKAGDEDKTLVGYDGPAALIDAKHHDMPTEETLFLDA